jgi:hypothetical protein
MEIVGEFRDIATEALLHRFDPFGDAIRQSSFRGDLDVAPDEGG